MTQQNPDLAAPDTDASEESRAAELSEQQRVRRAKRADLLERGVEPYPVGVPVTTTIAAVREQHEDALEAGEETQDVVGVAGRVVFQRNTGKLCFATLQDGEGRRLQVMLSQGEVGEESLERFKVDVDLGDHLFARGRVIKSRRGELSIFADSWQLAAKSLRPLPVLHKDLSEESRVRQRYVDLIVRPEARETARLRAAALRAVRDYLHAREYVEVETPVLQALYGGATARPFTTHLNAFDMDVFLRIAPELFLKRAVVGGIERVFEISRNFRNEGVDSTHSPEFTSLEAYEAYGDYHSMAVLTRELIQAAALEGTGSTLVTLADGTDYDLGGEWTTLSLYESLSEKIGEEITPEASVEKLLALVRRFDDDVDPLRQTHGKLVEELWEHHVGDHLWEPTFVVDFPVDTSPLTRAHRSVPGKVEKWDLYIRGTELATAYSELVDPVVQRERFEAQAALIAAGDVEAMRLDEDFLTAMEYAMPPAGGMGLGIDRLLGAITGLGVRETILFPFVKPIG
ncbi:MAG: lysine--tRNA ligase [Actinomycetales bacterium]|nr:lysine--tRNA ligase [Actinomycetales bacterium]